MYVHPARYTWEFLKENDLSTVTFFPEKYGRALSYLGSHSGRDGDKVKASGLTPKPFESSVTFEEADLTFLCRKIYQAPFERERMSEDIREFNSGWEPHWMFIGEIEDVIDTREA